MSEGKILLIVVIAFFVLRFIWRKLKSPSRTTMMVFLDTIFEIPAALKIGPWSSHPNIYPGKLEAERFGDSGKRVVNIYELTRRVSFAKSQCRFSPGGHIFVRNMYDLRLDEKTKFFSYLDRHPAVLQVKIKAPVFVIGFTRTGTTFLHEMLGLHEDVRSHYTWEQLNVVPATESEKIEDLSIARQKRYKHGMILFSFMKNHVLGEKIQYIHRIDYDEPEECTIPCSLGLPWMLFTIPLMVYAAEELLPLGAGDTFDMYKMFLQLQTFQAPDRRDKDFTWMLKCPFHLPYLRELANTFPGCTIVWTHRNPVECFASACSLFNTIMHMNCEEDSIDPKLMGEAVMKYSRLCLDMAEKALEELQGKINIVHVRYQDNVKNPKVAVKEVLEKVSSAISLIVDEFHYNRFLS